MCTHARFVYAWYDLGTVVWPATQATTGKRADMRAKFLLSKTVERITWANYYSGRKAPSLKMLLFFFCPCPTFDWFAVS